MAIRTLSVWDGVPDADKLKDMLFLARNKNASTTDRQYAISYLTGAVKVLAGIERRQALADYLARQLRNIKATMYYSGNTDANQTHG